jgi:hypothetical protein
MQPERLPLAKQQRYGFKCFLFESLNWSMFVSVVPYQPLLQTGIAILEDLDGKIVK